MRSSLEHKTVRPGLTAYSFYRSNRQPVRRRPATHSAKTHHRRGHAVIGLLLFIVVGFGLFAGYRTYSANQGMQQSSPPVTAAQAATVVDPKECASNTADKLVVVSVQKRHLWACEKQNMRYNAPVVTGIEGVPATKTPRGTYHIYGKQTDTVLTGSDSTGSWRDPVYYWMPFLNNEHGTFGFHDATWRPASDFGNIDPNSSKASHGCINLSLATAKWLYSWAPVGTTVLVKD